MTLTGVLIMNPPVPGSSEWLGHMSASKVASAIGMVGAFDSPMGLWSKMTGRTPGNTATGPQLTYGRYLEPALLAWCADQYPEYEITPGASYHHPSNRRFTAAPDGHATHRETGEVVLIEAKTARDAWQWGEPGTAEIPPKYAAQVAWQFYVTGARKAFVPVDVGMEFKMYVVTWEDVSEDIDGMVHAVESFMSYVDSDTPPDWDGSDSTYQAVRYWHPEIENAEHTVSTEVAQELAGAIRARQKAQSVERQLKAQLLAEMGAARKAVTPGGMAVCTRSSRNGATPSLIVSRGLSQIAPAETPLVA